MAASLGKTTPVEGNAPPAAALERVLNFLPDGRAMEAVRIFDTTSTDGEQSPGATLTLADGKEALSSDVTGAEWEFVVPYLTLMKERAPPREHDLRGVFNAMRWIVRTGSPWRYMPNDVPPWETVYQQTQGWLAAGVFEAMAMRLFAAA